MRAMIAILLALAGAASVLAAVIGELAGWGYPGLGRAQMALILGGLVLIVAGHWMSRPSGRRVSRRDVPGLMGTLAALALVALFGWSSRPAPDEGPDPRLAERLLDLERDVRPPRRPLGRCVVPDPAAPLPAVALAPVADGLLAPVYVTTAGDGSGRLFVVEKAGTIRIVEPDGRVRPEPFLDIRESVVSDAREDVKTVSWEQGLLSVAFAPDYATSGRFYVAYTAFPDGTPTIERFEVGADPDRADVASRRIVLQVPTVGPSHNGGQLQFGPDGYLYASFGDGYGFRWPDGDPDVYGDGAAEVLYPEERPVVPAGSDYTEDDVVKEDPWNQGQDPGTLRGAIVRIDVSGDSGYVVPPDNPFAGDDDEGTRGEVWAYGFRNPWRFSIDPCDGSLFAGDVGRSSYEEVDLVQPGRNYGWKIMEGGHCGPPWEPTCDTEGLEFPIAEYGHTDIDPLGGNAVIGGYVYRGRRIPGLAGRYVFGDFMSSRIWALQPDPYAASGWSKRELLVPGLLITSFGVDAEGEMLVVGYGGTVHRIVPAGPSA